MTDEALMILRRLEPALLRVEARVNAVATAQRRERLPVAAQRDQVRRMSARIPSTWVIAGAFAAINGVIVAAVFGLALLT